MLGRGGVGPRLDGWFPSQMASNSEYVSVSDGHQHVARAASPLRSNIAKTMFCKYPTIPMFALDNSFGDIGVVCHFRFLMLHFVKSTCYKRLGVLRYQDHFINMD